MTSTSLVSKIEETIALYESSTGYPATRTRQMIDRYGHLEALSRLMISPDLQQGFQVLRDKDQLQDSFESLVVANSDQFSKHAVSAAQWRLDHPYELL